MQKQLQGQTRHHVESKDSLVMVREWIAEASS